MDFFYSRICDREFDSESNGTKIFLEKHREGTLISKKLLYYVIIDDVIHKKTLQITVKCRITSVEGRISTVFDSVDYILLV